MPNAPPPLAARLFGPAELSLRGVPVPCVRSRKERWLLCLLILHAGRELERDWLAGLLWLDSAQGIAQANLRRSLNDLRHVLGEEACLIRAPRPRTLLLDPGDADADVLAFDRLIARGDPTSLEMAVGLYRGPLLEGCHEGWAFQERQVREEAYLNALETLASRAVAADPRSAVGYLRRIVATDPLRESAHRALMQALAAGGNHAASLAAYRELRSVLRRELHLKPDPETESLYRQIEAEMARHSAMSRRTSDRSAAAPGRASGDVAPLHNLPHPATSFIGREREMDEIPRLLEVTRLLTITGAGGCGKSRLALEVARVLCEEAPDGAWLVELAALADPALVPQAVATALSVHERVGEALTETLVSFLKPKRLLLVLDNCEHLLPACVALTDTLLRACPELRVLATSREPLSMLGETTYRIPSLSLPPEGVGCWELGAGTRPASPNTQHLTPDTLLASDAVRLFLDRAAAAQPGFVLAPENAGAVARICRRLDGIPLAIEMAAARLRALPVETLADRLEDALRLLTEGNRAALPRHRTLRAMIEWSYNLLSEPEKLLLRRLAVFAGGWTIEAAETVCSEGGIRCSVFGVWNEPESSRTPNTEHRTPKPEVLDLLMRLVDRSLVVMEAGSSEARYRFLEPILQFAQECLTVSGEGETFRRQHADYYLALAEAAEPHLTGPQQQAWLERLEQERDNLRAVLGWAVASANSQPGGEAAEIGLCLVGAVSWFWYIRGDYAEGRRWLASLLGLLGQDAHHGAEASPAIRAKALNAAGVLAWPQGDLRAARTFHQESLSLAQELGDRPLIARSLMDLGNTCTYLGEFEAARIYQEGSLAIFRELGDRRRISALYNNLGITTREQGDHERSRTLLEGSLRMAHEMGPRQRTVYPLVGLGILRMIGGDYPNALAYYEESRAVAQEVQEPRMLAVAIGLIGTVARYHGDLVTARTRYAESLRIGQALGGHVRLQDWLIGLGCVEIMSGETAGAEDEEAARCLRRGARLFGAAEAVLEATGGVIWAHDRPDYERCVAAARAGLGEAGEARFGASGSERQRWGPGPGFAAAWAEGRAMSLAAAVEYALEEGGNV